MATFANPTSLSSYKPDSDWRPQEVEGEELCSGLLRDRALEMRLPRHNAWGQKRRWNKRGGAPEKTEKFTRTSSPAEGTKCPFFEEPEQKKGTLTALRPS